MTDQRYMRSGIRFAMGKAVEEAGEFLAAMGKTMRWGWQSYNPELPEEKRESNADWVRREMADLLDALNNLENEMTRQRWPGSAAEAPPRPAPSAPAGAIDDAISLRHPWRAVDGQDWEYLFSKLGYGGRDKFWRAVLSEMRAALTAPR